MLIQFLTGLHVTNIQHGSPSEVGMEWWVLGGLRSWEEQDLAYFLIHGSWNTYWASQYTVSLMQMCHIQLSIGLKPLRRTYSVLKVSLFVRESVLVRLRTEIKMWSQVFWYAKKILFLSSLRSVLDKNHTYKWGTTNSILWLTSQWMPDIINFNICIIRSFNFKVVIKKILWHIVKEMSFFL